VTFQPSKACTIRHVSHSGGVGGGSGGDGRNRSALTPSGSPRRCHPSIFGPLWAADVQPLLVRAKRRNRIFCEGRDKGSRRGTVGPRPSCNHPPAKPAIPPRRGGAVPREGPRAGERVGPRGVFVFCGPELLAVGMLMRQEEFRSFREMVGEVGRYHRLGLFYMTCALTL
jgi:hypothetical protein